MTRRQKQELFISLRESGRIAEQVDYPTVGDQFETPEDFRWACFMASWYHGILFLPVLNSRRCKSLKGLQFLSIICVAHPYPASKDGFDHGASPCLLVRVL